MNQQTPPWTAAVEIGGTKLQVAVGRADQPELLDLRRATVDRDLGAAGIRSQLAVILAELQQHHAIEHVSIGFGGPVDRGLGRTIRSNQIAGWDDFPLVEWAERTCGVPASLVNDCDAAALGEARRGAASDAGAMFYITVGTGIGGGFIVSGRPVGWDGPAIAEIGQLQPHVLDTAMTVERWSSGQGIEHRFAQHHGDTVDQGDTEHQSSIPSGAKEPCSRSLAGVPDIAARARRGDVVARRVLDEAWEVLGWAVAQMVTLLAVEVVVIGGGVSLLGEQQFFVPVRRAAEARVYAPLRDRFRIVPAALGEQVVLHGAIEAVLLNE